MAISGAARLIPPAELLTQGLEWPLAAALGLLTARLVFTANQRPSVGWVMLVPLCLAAYLMRPAPAAVAGAIAGWAVGGGGIFGRLSGVVPGFSAWVRAVSADTSALWGAGLAALAWLWPDDTPAWGLLLVPLLIVLLLLPPRLAGTPRWIANPLARTQERMLLVVHTGRLGRDLLVAALIALSNAALVVAILAWPSSRPTIFASAAAILFIGMALTYGHRNYRRAAQRALTSRTVRVAAVAVDAPPEDCVGTPSAARDARILTRYEPYVEQAIREGAKLLVLPECCVRVDRASRAYALDSLSRWARQGNVALVVGLYDHDTQTNELVILNSDGAVVASYEKQHPAPVEPKRRKRMPPALAHVDVPDQLSLSGVICVDLDYGDVIRPVQRARGLLAVPANDWWELAELHHNAAVWASVLCGVPVVRSTSYGISAIFDCAGRVIARHSSFDGPTVLVADVPISM